MTVVGYDEAYCEVRYSDGTVSGGYYHDRFELVLEHPNPPHKHAELIKAWADGADIQYHSSGSWYLTCSPTWHPEEEYRIKPQKSDKGIQIERLEQQALDLANEIKKLKEH